MGGMPQDPLSALASALLRLTKTPLFFPQKGLECLDSEHPPLLLVLVVTEEIEKAKEPGNQNHLRFALLYEARI